MSKQNTLIVLAILLFVVVPVVLFAMLSTKPPESGKYDALASCLTDKGVKFYGAYWCSHCKAQKEMFGSSFERLKYIECSLPGGQGQTEECNKAGIKGYPTWEFGDGERLSGEVALATLAEKSECSLQ